MTKNTKNSSKGVHKKVAKLALAEIKKEKVKTPEEAEKALSTELTKYGLEAKEDFQIKNPITGEVKTVTLSRAGVQEADLIVALADPNTTREQKDHALSMYFWGRGAESASMMVDLMQYKGLHTKETRVFKSQIRFDFEALISSLVEHLETQARNTANILGINLEQEIRDYKEWLEGLPKGDERTLYSDFYMSKFDDIDSLQQTERLECAMVSEAIYQLDEAQKLTDARKNITAAREREKGKGIYIDSHGRPYTIDDPEITEIVEADRKATQEIEHE